MNIDESGAAGNEGRYRDRPFRQKGPRPERPPRQEADPNSNFK